MPENGNAHDSEDCLPDCEHPDHAYDGDPIDIELMLKRRIAFLRRYDPTDEDLDLPNPEGPVQL
jgi:hypothetical protein